MNIFEHRITVKPLTALQLMESLCDFCSEPLTRLQQSDRLRNCLLFGRKPAGDHKLSYEIIGFA
jgi:hypothetical protein